MAEGSGDMLCNLTVEIRHGSAVGSGVNTTTRFPRAHISLVRNGHRDILLSVDCSKTSNKYPLQNVVIHDRFAGEGKATIRLAEQNRVLYLSNCPPQALARFLILLRVKGRVQHTSGPGHQGPSARSRLLSATVANIDLISPITKHDLEKLHKNQSQKRCSTTPSRLTQTQTCSKISRKRCRQDLFDNKENMTPADEQHDAKRRHVAVATAPKPRPVVRVPRSEGMTSEQRCVLNAVLQGSNIFYTGSAGTGKSHLLRSIIGSLPPQSTFVTASTGIAACHIGGTTLHSFAGIGCGTSELLRCIELAHRPVVKQHWLKCKTLIIDEISMIDAELFDKLDQVGRAVRKQDKPFGGIQLVLCGDFLQLPPVSKDQQIRKFAFQSVSWPSCIDRRFELKQVHRQTEPEFINILQNIRVGRCTERIANKLRSTVNHDVNKHGILATKLCTHSRDVELINKRHLEDLSGDSVQFGAVDSDMAYTKTLNTSSPADQQLVLKPGAQVILLKNMDMATGLVNGARGVVTGFDQKNQGLPRVRFLSGAEHLIRTECWSVRISGLLVTRRQLPLKLAWAISIHKSQGMSLDCVEMSLSKVFEFGQAYVALSRAKSLSGLRVLDFSSTTVQAHPDVLKFYMALHSELAANNNCTTTRLPIRI